MRYSLKTGGFWLAFYSRKSKRIILLIIYFSYYFFLLSNAFFLLFSDPNMAHQTPSNFSCLEVVKHAYHTCADRATETVTSSVEWSYTSTIGRIVQPGLTIDRSVLLFVAACVLVAAILFSCVQFISNSSFRHELHEALEIIVNLFTAHLSFAALLINSIWFFGQVLAGVCDLLTLNPR